MYCGPKAERVCLISDHRTVRIVLTDVEAIVGLPREIVFRKKIIVVIALYDGAVDMMTGDVVVSRWDLGSNLSIRSGGNATIPRTKLFIVDVCSGVDATSRDCRMFILIG